MQTPRHPVFAALALCTIACRVPVGRTQPATATPSATSLALSPRVPEPAPKRQVVFVHDPGPQSPRIAAAQFRSRATLQLTFSEPIAVHDGFDPHQFRLSLGMRDEDGDESMAYYYDLGAYTDDEGPLAQFDHLEPQSEDTVLLHLNMPIPTDVCETLRELKDAADEDASTSGGLYLHYHHAPKRPAIVDAQDNALGDVSAQWVIRGAKAASYYGSGLNSMGAYGPLLCPLP